MVDSHLRAFFRTDVTGDASVFDVFHYFPSEDGPKEAGDLTKNACVKMVDPILPSDGSQVLVSHVILCHCVLLLIISSS